MPRVFSSCHNRHRLMCCLTYDGWFDYAMGKIPLYVVCLWVMMPPCWLRDALILNNNSAIATRSDDKV